MQDVSGKSDRTTISISAESLVYQYCQVDPQNFCFWQQVSYKIRENSPPSILGSLNSPLLSAACRKHKVNYTLISGKFLQEATNSKITNQLLSLFIDSHQFSLGRPVGLSKAWFLQTVKALDRDVNRTIQRRKEQDNAQFGEYRKVGVKCTVIYDSGHVQDFEKVLEVRVIDEDDNIPKPQADNEVEVYLESNIVHKVNIYIYIFMFLQKR